ncbi:MAG: hypothetical protein IIV60_06135, partial [Alistipes sp.]|nr:hypothetical protein [Alistipes sp.]
KSIAWQFLRLWEQVFSKIRHGLEGIFIIHSGSLFVIRDQLSAEIVDKIDWVKVSKDTPYGKLSVNWEKKGAKVDINVEIPVGSTATLYTPDNKTVTLPSGHHSISCDIVK